jgi:hypothetical protein
MQESGFVDTRREVCVHKTPNVRENIYEDFTHEEDTGSAKEGSGTPKPPAQEKRSGRWIVLTLFCFCMEAMYQIL